MSSGGEGNKVAARIRGEGRDAVNLGAAQRPRNREFQPSQGHGEWEEVKWNGGEEVEDHGNGRSIGSCATFICNSDHCHPKPCGMSALLPGEIGGYSNRSGTDHLALQ